MSNQTTPKFSPWRWAHQACIFLPETIVGAEPREYSRMAEGFQTAAFDSIDPTGAAPSVCADAVRAFCVGA